MTSMVAVQASTALGKATVKSIPITAGSVVASTRKNSPYYTQISVHCILRANLIALT